jgi:hypothetical protein
MPPTSVSIPEMDPGTSASAALGVLVFILAGDAR